MALTKTVDFKGISVADAYVKIESAVVMRNSDNEFICRLTFVEKVNRESLEYFNDLTEEFLFDLNGANPLTQGYAFIKTLTRYEGAVDV